MEHFLPMMSRLIHTRSYYVTFGAIGHIAWNRRNSRSGRGRPASKTSLHHNCRSSRIGHSRESADRVRSAIQQSGYTFPKKRVVINLAPAGLKKNGAAFDLPIAMGILAAMNKIPNNHAIMRCSLENSLYPEKYVLYTACSHLPSWPKNGYQKSLCSARKCTRSIHRSQYRSLSGSNTSRSYREVHTKSSAYQEQSIIQKRSNRSLIYKMFVVSIDAKEHWKSLLQEDTICS